MYHALGYGTIMYIQAVMTFDMVSIVCSKVPLLKTYQC